MSSNLGKVSQKKTKTPHTWGILYGYVCDLIFNLLHHRRFSRIDRKFQNFKPHHQSTKTNMSTNVSPLSSVHTPQLQTSSSSRGQQQSPALLCASVAFDRCLSLPLLDCGPLSHIYFFTFLFFCLFSPFPSPTPPSTTATRPENRCSYSWLSFIWSMDKPGTGLQWIYI